MSERDWEERERWRAEFYPDRLMAGFAGWVGGGLVLFGVEYGWGIYRAFLVWAGLAAVIRAWAAYCRFRLGRDYARTETSGPSMRPHPSEELPASEREALSAGRVLVLSTAVAALICGGAVWWAWRNGDVFRVVLYGLVGLGVSAYCAWTWREYRYIAGPEEEK